MAQMLKAALKVFCEKRCSLRFRKKSQETLVPQETPVNFAKILRAPFLQNNFGRLLLKWGHCKNEAREINCLCCSEVDAMLIASAKIIIIIIELTHSKTILEITAEIEPQPAALDFKNLSIF